MSVVAALYALAILVMLLYGGNLLWLSWQYAAGERPHEAAPLAPPDEVPDDEVYPDITVQLPVYNEMNVIERLIDACARLDYPSHRLEIQVLDDSTDGTSALVAARVDYWRARGREIMHIRRHDRAGFKAGALQNGLQRARGQYIAVFDADFLPQPRFLRDLLPSFDHPNIGAVQARWGHLNAGDSLLTRLQGFGLDMHFAIEQYVRPRMGYFMTFNGTAGIWRRTCIEDAGGWQADTLTEDMDLSYRAQMMGWRFRYRPDIEAPAELPALMSSLRAQQFRWAKGAAETTRKLLLRLWRSEYELPVKLQGTLHLTGHFVFYFILLAALLHAPLLYLEATGDGPGVAYFLATAVGLVGFSGFALAHVLAQRALYPDWVTRLRLLPIFVAGSMGLALDGARALAQGLRRRATLFMRTPKLNMSSKGRPKRYDVSAGIPGIVWLEAVVACYSFAGCAALVATGQWAALPFQMLFAAGFGLVATTSIRHQASDKRAGRRERCNTAPGSVSYPVRPPSRETAHLAVHAASRDHIPPASDHV